MNKILIIDDNKADRLISRIALEQAGYAVVEADNATDGVKAIIQEKPICIVLDHLMAHGNGLVVLDQLDRRNINPPPVIFVSTAMQESVKRQALALGARVCLDKTELYMDTLVKEVKEAIAFYYPDMKEKAS